MQQKTLQPVEVYELSWQIVRMDLFQEKNLPFLIIEDYYCNSGLIEFSKLDTTKSQTVIRHSKSIVDRLGILLKV